MIYCEAMERSVEVKCPDCGSRDIDEDSVRGERSCLDCGLVLSENLIDPGQEWSDFGDVDDRARAGPPPSVLLHDKGLSTVMDWANKDFSGKSLTGRSLSQLYRMRKWQRRARSHTAFERNMESALIEISRLGGTMMMTKAVKEETAVIYKRALELDMVRGRSIDAMVAASMYLANQKLQAARSLDDFDRHSRVSRKSITRAHKIIKSKLRMRVSVSEPEEYVGRYCSLLGLTPKIATEARHMLSEAKTMELTDGKSPTGAAAAAVYIASKLNGSSRTQREIADISGVTEVTIRNRYKEITSHLGIELD